MTKTNSAGHLVLISSILEAGQTNGSAAQVEPDALDAYSRVVTQVVDRLTPSVASIRVRQGQGRSTFEGGGSAVAIAPDGYLLTSAHVVGPTKKGTARFSDGRTFDIEVVGADPLSDLAVVRASASDLPPAGLGDATSLRVGQLVVAPATPAALWPAATRR